MTRQTTSPEPYEIFTLDEGLLAQRKLANLRRMHTVQIPALRAAGFVILCIIAALQDWRTPAPFPQPALLWLIGLNLTYAALAWLAQRIGFDVSRHDDMSLLMFHLDVLVWLPNLYYLEQGNLLLGFFLLTRVVDQVGFGFRRSMYFCHVVTAAYLAYSAWVSFADPGRADWSDRTGIAAFMYLLGLYVALIGRVPERLRNRTRQAIHTARELVKSQAQKADALQAQAVELEKARRQAEQASLAKSQFLAVTSHEIRTPMNGVLGAAELLMGTPLSATQQRYVRTVHRSATALLGLIDDVLDLSRIEAGKLTLRTSSVDLRALADEAVDLIAMTARDKPVTLSGTVAQEVPITVRADPARLRQLLVNLLHNAVKFTDRGSVRLDITRIGGPDDGNRLRFSVRDTGIGIAADKVESIFGAFTQVDASSTRRHGGSGLGLAVVKELSELMGGQVGVESKLGEGSHFWVDLTLAPGTVAVEAAPTANAQGDVGSVSVLLAEDDQVNQMVVEGMLKLLGCSVDVVNDGAAALHAASRHRYDILFMDCHMPVMDGYEATRRIRDDEARSGRRTSIVALTADALASDRERCMAAGMDDFLTKPVSSAQLASAIRRWTGRQTNPATQW